MVELAHTHANTAIDTDVDAAHALAGRIARLSVADRFQLAGALVLDGRLELAEAVARGAVEIIAAARLADALIGDRRQ